MGSLQVLQFPTPKRYFLVLSHFCSWNATPFCDNQRNIQYWVCDCPHLPPGSPCILIVVVVIACVWPRGRREDDHALVLCGSLFYSSVISRSFSRANSRIVLLVFVVFPSISFKHCVLSFTKVLRNCLTSLLAQMRVARSLYKKVRFSNYLRHYILFLFFLAFIIVLSSR